LKDAHNEAINAIIHIENGNIIATGDDDGIVKIWDLRQAHQGKKSCVLEFKEHEGSIQGFDYSAENKMLLTAANDGTLGVFDLRKPILYAMSDSFGEDQNAVLIMKDGKKVMTASGEGVLNLFTWDWFGDCNDRIVGHPNSI
jgi:WD40 repeat protein